MSFLPRSTIESVEGLNTIVTAYAVHVHVVTTSTRSIPSLGGSHLPPSSHPTLQTPSGSITTSSRTPATGVPCGLTAVQWRSDDEVAYEPEEAFWELVHTVYCLRALGVKGERSVSKTAKPQTPFYTPPSNECEARWRLQHAFSPAYAHSPSWTGRGTACLTIQREIVRHTRLNR